MANELNLDSLENNEGSEEIKTAKVAKEPKVVTAEEIQALNDGCDKIVMFGVTEKFAKVMELVPVWHDKDLSKPVKESVAEYFGGSDKLKDYVDTDFKAELEVINGIQKTCSVMNNIKAFYARRENVTRKAKTTQVNISGSYYSVNSEYLASIATYDGPQKRDLLLAHADTKKIDAIEVL